MTPNIYESLELFRTSANQNETAGEYARAVSSFAKFLYTQLSIALTACDRDEGIANLRDDETALALSKINDYAGSLGERFGERLAICELVPVAHFAWLIGDRAIGESLIDRVCCPPFPEKAGKFWGEYIRALSNLAKKEPYEPTLPKLSGIERHWATYLPLISDLTNHRTVGDSVAAIVESFNRSNSDKRLFVAGVPLDPTGSVPVRWDYRLEAIRAYAAEAYSVQF